MAMGSDAAAVAGEEKVGFPDTAVSAPAQAGAQDSVGRRLRAAREAAGLSVADVALSLKYGVRQIERLEADDYAALPGNTVVRGFTRSYARLLGLDADDMLRLLDKAMPRALADVRPPTNMGIATDDGGRLRLSPLAATAIVLALAALLLALWHFFGPKPAVKPQINAERERPAVQLLPQPPQPQQEAAPSQVQSSAAVPAPAIAEAPSTVGPKLEFVFEDRCWLEVIDADRRILHSGENPGGSRLTLTGKPPFDIVIGNARKVKLAYDERPIDLAPYTRAEVARLKLE